ncbi:MAG: STAS/SEC14 domain-containing protein [Sphingomonadales bacterium]|jgi:hypothetical protein|nr:STAS/SEC14 domain-containing protein [Sphingomonadales bacterium]
MLEVQEIDGLLHIEVGGKLTPSDYDAFVPFFEQVAKRKTGTVPMLIELTSDFAGWDISGIWRELKFDIRHKNKFGRIAIVGDRKWEEWGTKLSDLFFRADIRFFEADQNLAADAWVREAGL